MIVQLSPFGPHRPFWLKMRPTHWEHTVSAATQRLKADQCTLEGMVTVLVWLAGMFPGWGPVYDEAPSQPVLGASSVLCADQENERAHEGYIRNACRR